MANPIFGFPIHSDRTAATFSGGTWLSSGGMALANLKDPRLALITRSTAVTTASTQFDVNMGSTADVKVFALPKHTLSINAQVRLRASATAGDFTTTPLHDSGWLDVWPIIYPSGTLYYGHPSFFTGKLSAEDAVGYNVGYTYILSATVVAQHWRIEINDTANSVGYIDIGRVVLAAGWQPTIGIQYGAETGWTTGTTSTEMDGGAITYRVRPNRRRQQLTLNLPNDEALVWPFEIQRKLGIHKQLHFVFDPTDTVHMPRRAFLATLKQLSPLQYPYYSRNTVGMELIEVL